jgi:hypothetical protein
MQCFEITVYFLYGTVYMVFILSTISYCPRHLSWLLTERVREGGRLLLDALRMLYSVLSPKGTALCSSQN